MITFEHVVKVFAGRAVLDKLSFEVRKGETFVLLGPSGTGKSVLLKHMVKLMTPDSGRVLVDGDVISEAEGRDLERIRERFGFLFQGGALLAWMSVFENVAFPLREKTKMRRHEIKARVEEVLEMVGLQDDGKKLPAEISGGMRKRAGLARAIVHKPEIVLYDEPTSGLDPVSARKIDELIRDLGEKTAITSVVVTHDMHSALMIGDRITMLADGGVVASAIPSEFLGLKVPQVVQFLEAQFITRRGGWEKDMI